MRRLVTIFAILICTMNINGKCQTIDTTMQKLYGEWELIKHITRVNDQDSNIIASPPDRKQFVTYKKNGKFAAKVIQPNYITIVTEGKWKLINNGETIVIYEAKTKGSYKDLGDVPDYKIQIISLTNSELVAKEQLSWDFPKGTSYLRKVK